MRRTLAAALGGIALLAGLSVPAAHARPVFSCSGVPSQPKAYVCIVDSKGGATPSISEENLTVEEICVAFGFCTDPITQPAPMPGATLVPGWWLIVYYDGNCYYIYPDGHYDTEPSNAPENCP